ncbi:glutathione peroxidase [uncultured Hydrogenophaga sp.]|uniref:glutathione peroxidase n=1 Tax=uncultured Hydrogenophaga sp. TaxID=199683 RepID=UPI00265E6B64|nr:glutathione peroxidase [uncultured Hydrogenophaga sp.]
MQPASLFTLVALGALIWASPATAQTRPAGTPAAAATPADRCPALLQHRFDRLQDEKPQSLCQYAGRVTLVVNTASFCGFTQQYGALESLYSRYKDRGLVVLGFPTNDFGRQEPGSNASIADFCENTFGVKFPMFAKTSVVGGSTNPLYQQLAQRTGERPQWNFHKYLIDRSGRVVKSYASSVDPKDPSLMKDIERMLSEKS